MYVNIFEQSYQTNDSPISIPLSVNWILVAIFNQENI
jgi:hypothetical protein